jgi:hypothetical protein
MEGETNDIEMNDGGKIKDEESKTTEGATNKEANNKERKVLYIEW